MSVYLRFQVDNDEQEKFICDRFPGAECTQHRVTLRTSDADEDNSVQLIRQICPNANIYRSKDERAWLPIPQTPGVRRGDGWIAHTIDPQKTDID